MPSMPPDLDKYFESMPEEDPALTFEEALELLGLDDEDDDDPSIWDD